MKKHYIRIAVVIEALLLVVFLLGSGFFVYVFAGNEMRNHMEQAKILASVHTPKVTEDVGKEDFIKNAFTSYFEEYQYYRQRETGFYGKLILSDGAELDTANDYAYVYLTDDSFIENSEKRIIALEEGFADTYDLPSLYSPVFDGECDDVFIHGGNMTTSGKTYQIGDFSYETGERVPVSDWQGESGLYGKVVRFAENEHEQKLNEEAKSIYNDFYERMKSGVISGLTEENILTSYYIHYTGTQQGKFCTVQVFHPLQIALRGHIGALIGIFLVFLFVEFIVAFVISRLYKNRMEYEKKSKRLTRGIAHELKTPLAVTKAYVENWDCIDEEDREEYAEKINREVEDMSNMINVLLEMEKIDDGSIKINPEEVELSSLIKSVYNRIRPLAKERGLEVTLPEEGEYLIQADLKFFKIALGNYLTNMVKYADKTASVIIEESGKKYRVYFKNDSTNAGRSKTDKLNSNGMGVEINENIMNLHGFKNGADYRRTETVFWFEAEKT